jgi:crotonobetainyl-CoA:carnitine CoA-transferase CaiB-like acyl-CoA transferase
MAGQGADVIKIEPPQGDAARQTGPFPNDTPDPEASGLFLYLNTGKRSVTLDLKQDNQTILRMVKDADVVIENHPPGKLASLGLGYEDMARINPEVVVVSITPFGQYGPYRDFESSDIVVHALSGELYLAGRPKREPLKKGGNLSEYHGGLNGYLSVMAALYARQTSGRGQHIDVFLLEGATAVIGMAVKRWEYMGVVEARKGAEGHPWPNGIWSANDGYILAYSRPAVDWWTMFVNMMAEVGVEGFDDPVFKTAQGRAENVEVLDGLFQ